MSWMRLHDSFYSHPKVFRLSPLAFRLWVTAIAYCNRNHTDGFIPKAILPSLLQCPVRRKVRGRAIDELLEARSPYAGLWELDEEHGGYRVHDFLDWNPSRAEVEHGVEEIEAEIDVAREAAAALEDEEMER